MSANIDATSNTRTLKAHFLAQLSAKAIEGFGSMPGEALVDTSATLLLCSMSRPTLYRRMERGQFPPPAKRGLGKNYWRVADLRAWLAGGVA